MGSSALGTSVYINGKEKDFYAEIKRYVTGLSSIITCDNDPDDEFDDSTAGEDHIATLDFKINNVHAFTLCRPAALKSDGSEIGVYTIRCKMDINETIPDGSSDVRFREEYVTTSLQQSVTSTRGLIISHIINDNFVLLAFSPLDFNWQTQGPWNTTRFVHCFSSGSTFISASVGGNVALTKPSMFNISGFRMYDRSLTLSAGTFISRFPYAAPVGQIDYIKSSVFQNNDERTFENKAIYDCSTVSVGSTVSLKDGSYVAVGPHQLVKVS